MVPKSEEKSVMLMPQWEELSMESSLVRVY
jgi:hypothetical protein